MEKIYSKSEAELLVKQLQQVFSVVRILDSKEVAGQLDGDVCCCYSFWGKNKPCENCTSKLTLKDKKDRVKIEATGGHIFQVFCKHLNIEGNDCVLEILKDITDINIDQDDLQELGKKFLTDDSIYFKDALTNVYNRSYFEKIQNESFKDAGIAIVDMDYLKDTNDIYGHEMGDFALKSIANVLIKDVRSGDHIIRYGGDEFIIIMPNIQKTTLVTRLEKIRQEINNISLPERENIKLSVSIGAIISENVPLIEAFKETDELMYKAKRYKNRVVVEWNENEIQSANTSTNKQKILVVDDSKIEREIIKMMLSQEYEILEAEDGVKGIEIIDEYKQNINLILLDIEMPNINGFEYLKYLKEKEYLYDVPVIMISNSDDAQTIIKTYELGAIDYLTKPFNKIIIEQKINNIIKLYLKQRKFKEELMIKNKETK